MDDQGLRSSVWFMDMQHATCNFGGMIAIKIKMQDGPRYVHIDEEAHNGCDYYMYI
jgi:hypothetical protein